MDGLGGCATIAPHDEHTHRVGFLFTGCDGGEATTDAGGGGSDSGTMRDGGGGTDSGTDDEDAGPGTDAGPGDDAGPPSCSATLAPTGDVPDLIISEIDPGSFIEVFNTTGADITITADQFQLCSRPAYTLLSTVGGGVVVPAGGFAELDWPGSFADTDGGGEIALYEAPGDFFAASNLLDFVCWGANPHSGDSSRLDVAQTGDRWSGDCAPAITGGGSLVRVAGNDGNLAAHYAVSATPTPETCAP